MLPVLAPPQPLRIAEPVARGRPGCGYPWPWSIYTWIDGEPARSEIVADLAALAARLAEFLVALGHAASDRDSSAGRSAARARLRREATVPGGIPTTSATSS